MANLPYVTSVKTLLNMLKKIEAAAVPPTFSQKFVSDVLLMKGGTPRATMPFLKKMGLVADDGTPTELYKAVRNEKKAGKAIAKSMRKLYQPLFAMNKNVYKLPDNEVKGLIVESTGGQKTSQVTKLTLATFKALRELSDFTSEAVEAPNSEQAAVDIRQSPYQDVDTPQQNQIGNVETREAINLSYTINLNLPPTADIEVFNSIFRALKEHLLSR